MKIYLVRHAIAESREQFKKSGLDDSLRPLVPKGRKRMQKMTVLLRDYFEDVDIIVSSPYVRAKQTALILSQIMFDLPIAEAPELVPQSPPQSFVKWLKSHSDYKRNIIIVGHEPQLSTFASYLLAGQMQSFIDLKKSGILALEFESLKDLGPQSARLLWALSPKVIESTLG